jgi:hypothetical protein
LQRSKFRSFTYAITALGALLQEKRHLDPERFGGDEETAVLGSPRRTVAIGAIAESE